MLYALDFASDNWLYMAKSENRVDFMRSIEAKVERKRKSESESVRARARAIAKARARVRARVFYDRVVFNERENRNKRDENDRPERLVIDRETGK